MADRFSAKMRSSIMARIGSKNSSSEKRVRSFLFAHGRRFRIHQKGLPGTPDIVLPGCNTVVFVNGCFWHGHRL